MMKRCFIIILFCISYLNSNAQVDSTFVDSKYFEDQFYVGLSYNALLKPPEDFLQNGLSGSFAIGYIRDIPLNKNRNVGFGIGLGYAFNAYIQNMKISKVGGETVFEMIDTRDYNINRFYTHLVEMPIEIRWRTSTPTKYSFWRIYGGVKLGYVFSNKSRYEDSNETVSLKNIDEIDTFQYGLSLSVGYSSLNINVYYGLKGLFKDAETTSGESIDLTQLNIGFIFYIL